MAKLNKDNLGYLGIDYQMRLMAQILTDTRFANALIDIVDPNYFEDPYLRVIAATIKEAKEIDDIVPDMGSIEFRLLELVNDEVQQKYAIKQLEKLREVSLYDSFKVQDIAMKFCKQQELKKSIKQIQKIIDKGDIENYEECESILRKALEHGDSKDDGMLVFENLKEVLSEDFRRPIRTGIEGLDEVMDGGLSKGELAVILAPFGVGKTTMMTKIANTAASDGNKVLQIFFEDNPKVIQRKHLACLTGVELNNLSLYKDEIIEKAEKVKDTLGRLKLKKFPSDGTTIPIIRQYIRRKIAEGFRPDIVLIDYIDCVEPSKTYADVNVGEGSVMRQFESMLSELDIAGWTAVQGNRSSIKANVVEADQMGGSIKKGQIGHFIVSIAKSLDQKDEGTATMAVLKSRFGKDGIIFEDIKFDNSTIQIDMGQSKGGKTKTEHNKSVELSQQIRVNNVLNAFTERRNAIDQV
jgi:RecA/RadA recombinase